MVSCEVNRDRVNESLWILLNTQITRLRLCLLKATRLCRKVNNCFRKIRAISQITANYRELPWFPVSFIEIRFDLRAILCFRVLRNEEIDVRERLGDYLQALEWSLKHIRASVDESRGKYPFDKLAFVKCLFLYAFERSWKKNDYVAEMQLYRNGGVVLLNSADEKVKTKKKKSEEWFQKYILSEEYMSRCKTWCPGIVSLKKYYLIVNRNEIGCEWKII